MTAARILISLSLLSLLSLGGCSAQDRQDFARGFARGLEQQAMQPTTRCIYKKKRKTTYCYTY